MPEIGNIRSCNRVCNTLFLPNHSFIHSIYQFHTLSLAICMLEFTLSVSMNSQGSFFSFILLSHLATNCCELFDLGTVNMQRLNTLDHTHTHVVRIRCRFFACCIKQQDVSSRSFKSYKLRVRPAVDQACSSTSLQLCLLFCCVTSLDHRQLVLTNAVGEQHTSISVWEMKFCDPLLLQPKPRLQ